MAARVAELVCDAASPYDAAMRAAILAIGSELLGADRLDTNSLTLTETLEHGGVELIGKCVVGDSVERLEVAIGQLSSAAELVLVTGGLGPTVDDVTREAFALATGRSCWRARRSSRTSAASSPPSGARCRP